MTTEKTPKISKAVAIQLMDEQINQFALLRSTDANLEENFLSLFRKTVSMIYKFLSIDDTIIFIKIVVSNFDFQIHDLENNVPISHTYLEAKIKAAYVDTLHEKIKYLFIGTSDEYKIERIFKKSPGISLSSWDKISLFMENAGAYGAAGGLLGVVLFNAAGKKLWPPAYKIVKILILKTAADYIEQLRLYKMKIMQTWDDDAEYVVQIEQVKELSMGDKPTYSISNIIGSNLSGIVQGEYNTVVASLNAAGQPELAQALTTLTQAVLASHDLPADKKEEQVKVINQIGKEAAEPKPNKTLLKILVDGLLATLQAVPDVASAVAAVMPILSQLHLKTTPNAERSS